MPNEHGPGILCTQNGISELCTSILQAVYFEAGDTQNLASIFIYPYPNSNDSIQSANRESRKCHNFTVPLESFQTVDFFHILLRYSLILKWIK